MNAGPVPSGANCLSEWHKADVAIGPDDVRQG